MRVLCSSLVFFFNTPATTDIYTLSLHDALPISTRGESPRKDAGGFVLFRLGNLAENDEPAGVVGGVAADTGWLVILRQVRSEEHTSELQSPDHLVCRLLLEKKKQNNR